MKERCEYCNYLNSKGYCWALKAPADPDNVDCDFFPKTSNDELETDATGNCYSDADPGL